MYLGGSCISYTLFPHVHGFESLIDSVDIKVIPPSFFALLVLYCLCVYVYELVALLLYLSRLVFLVGSLCGVPLLFHYLIGTGYQPSLDKMFCPYC